METENKIKGVIFARSWWAAAVEALNPGDRLEFYDVVFLYAFNGQEATIKSPAVKAMFAMVRPYIDTEAERYAERCERNRKNAGGAKRVAASGTQPLPVAHNNNTNTNTNTNNNTNTISLSEERERFLIYSLFFAKGCADVEAEVTRFWSYYESLGWRNNKGATIVRKTSAARMWEFENNIQVQDLDARKMWAECMEGCAGTSPDVFTLWSRVTIEGDKITFYARDVERFAKACEGDFFAGLQKFAGRVGVKSVTYCSNG